MPGFSLFIKGATAVEETLLIKPTALREVSGLKDFLLVFKK
jgi:hypothetical protein